MSSPARMLTSGRTTALYLSVGAVWAFRSLQSFSDPDFADPDSVNDWLAVLSATLGAVLLGVALASLPASGRPRWGSALLGRRTPWARPRSSWAWP